MLKNYSLAKLKRDAKEGKLSAVMLVRNGSEVSQEDLPERLQGARKIVGANSCSLIFENPGDPNSVSYLDLPKASLVEYTDSFLRIYAPGFREPNAAEQRVLDEWKTIQSTEQYQMQLKADVLTDGSSTYWQERAFFQNSGMLYLMGLEKHRGMILDFNQRNRGANAIIRDESIRGDLLMEYKLERERSLRPALDSIIRSAENRPVAAEKDASQIEPSR